MAFLELRDIRVEFQRQGSGRAGGRVRAVDGVSLDIEKGETLGLVGESGCGKSTLARACTMLLPVAGGSVTLDGLCLTALSARRLRACRADFQMVFQDPYASLDPKMTVFAALAEALCVRERLRGEVLAEKVFALMRAVGLSADQARKYPHEFSGGQRQRVAVARALAPRPRLIVADEPVSALDVSVQSQIINLIRSLCRAGGLTMLFISHDLSVVHHVADRIAVMYLGRIVEIAPAGDILRSPHHPYTRALISAVPEPDPRRERTRSRIVLQGDPPSPLSPPAGCRFHPRCPYAVDACRRHDPRLTTCGPGRQAACLRLEELPPGRGI
jgi:oligopeptide/dipeptide ABC transporter ATP-binding protein